MEKIWRLNKQPDDKKTEILAEQLSVDKNVAAMLINRGVDTYDKAFNFFRPQLSGLHDPFLMNDMHKAVARLKIAIENNENILIYGDYDVDGTTGVALIYSFLKTIYDNVIYYIPDRYLEGYGISFKGIDFANRNNCKLIIAVDCGIKAVDKAEYASKLNIDLIICDHHTPDEIIPQCVAVLDAKRLDNTYPFNELSGCGVGFKFMQAYCIKENIPVENLLKFIDLTAVSIASDIVPVVDENRILAFYGLKKLNTDPLPAFKALINDSKSEKQLVMQDVVFTIGPRINAAGRIKSGAEAVELLISTNIDQADEFSRQISLYNQERKELDKAITDEALDQISKDNSQNKKTTVVAGKNWHRGVVGIVASRLTETHYKPTVVFSNTDGNLTGSARSVGNFDLYAALDSCSRYLEKFGGHKFAAGLNIKEENLEAFKVAFEKYVGDNIRDEDTKPALNIEREVSFKVLTSKFYRIIQQFEPFGPENEIPIFATSGVCDTGNTKIVGKTGEHLKIEVMDSTGTIISGIAFSMAGYYKQIKTGKKFDICYTLEKNVFRGTETLQIMVKDIKI